MAGSSATSGTGVRAVKRTQRYFWPEGPLNGLLLLVLACGITNIVVFAMVMNQQSHFRLGVPWIVPYGITLGALTIALWLVFNILIINRNLIPGVVIMLSILFFALYITATIGTGITVFGPGSTVSSQCKNSVTGMPIFGQSVATLAWLELDSICSSWYAVFSFNLLATFIFFGFNFFAAGVSRNQVDTEQELGPDMRVR